MELSHDEIRELLPAFAMGAVPKDEAAAIRAHILTCEECTREVDAFADTSARLALTGGEEPLPAGFADRVMAAALGDRSEAAAAPVSERRRKSFWPALAGAGVSEERDRPGVDPAGKPDHQPLEASGMVSACLEAFRLTGQSHWAEWARTTMTSFPSRRYLASNADLLVKPARPASSPAA